MKVSKFQEGVLGCILYLSLAVTTFMGGPISERIGRKRMLLLSLYTSCLSTIFSSVTGSYFGLVVSRATIGLCIGCNFSVTCMFVSEMASGPRVKDSILLVVNVAYTFGGVWVGLAAYLLLENFGWRKFVLFTSLPAFIVCILILHFVAFIKSSKEESKKLETSQDNNELSKNVFQDNNELTNSVFLQRLCKMCLMKFATLFDGMGTVLLFPSLIQLFNSHRNHTETAPADQPGDSCSMLITQGPEFLLLSLVAAATIGGRISSYFLHRRIRFRLLNIIPSISLVVSYGLMFKQGFLAIIVIGNFMIKFMYGFISMQINFISYDTSFYGSNRFSLATSVVEGSGVAGLTLGTGVAAFAPPLAAVATSLCISVLLVPMILTMSELD